MAVIAIRNRTSQFYDAYLLQGRVRDAVGLDAQSVPVLVYALEQRGQRLHVVAVREHEHGLGGHLLHRLRAAHGLRHKLPQPPGLCAPRHGSISSWHV